MEKGAKLVSSAMLGLDGETIMVGGKVYLMMPPTIKKIAQGGYYLSSFGDERNISDVYRSLHEMGNLTKALSCFISGDVGLNDALMEGTMEEVIEGIEMALKLIGTENFPRLSLLSRNVQRVIANTK